MDSIGGIRSVLVQFGGFCCIAVFVASLLRCVLFNLSEKRLFPQEWRWPVVGDVIHILWTFDRVHDVAVSIFLRSGKRYQDARAPGIHIISIVDPVDVEHVLKRNWENYHVGEGLRSESVRDVFGRGIFNADGKHWLLQRKHAAREFSANIFRDFMTARFIDYSTLLSGILAANIGRRMDMHALLFQMTLDAHREDCVWGWTLGG